MSSIPSSNNVNRSYASFLSVLKDNPAALFLSAAIFTAPLLLLLFTLSLTNKLTFSESQSLQENIAAPAEATTNIIRAAIRISPATSFDRLHGQLGFEHELLNQFAQYAGKKLELVEYKSVEAMYNALDENEVDIVSSGYGISELFSDTYDMSQSYRDEKIVTVYKTGNHRPLIAKHLLNKRVATIANSQHSDELRNLQQQLPSLAWQELETIDYIDLLSRVESKEIDVALISLTDFQMYRGAFPSLGVGFSSPNKIEHRWGFGENERQKHIADLAKSFFDQRQTTAEISILKERYFSPSEGLNQYSAYEFARNIKKRLPQHIDLIETVAADNYVDWRFLAAVSYQESNWIPQATSPTGVRGMMMLTRKTAGEMGISDRLDVENSLRGGIGYYLKLRNRLPLSITGPDRDWMALAAYNVGAGHLEDARVIAQRKGGNPNLWHDVKHALPLLQQAKYYKNSRRGYARGREALHYVQQIRHYIDVLILNDFVEQHRIYLANNPSRLNTVNAITKTDNKLDLALTEKGKTQKGSEASSKTKVINVSSSSDYLDLEPSSTSI